MKAGGGHRPALFTLTQVAVRGHARTVLSQRIRNILLLNLFLPEWGPPLLGSVCRRLYVCRPRA